MILYNTIRRAKRYSASINPSALRRKTPSGKEPQPKVRGIVEDCSWCGGVGYTCDETVTCYVDH